jgi:hypothetical protein
LRAIGWLALRGQVEGEGVRGFEGVGVVVAEDAAAAFQRVPVEVAGRPCLAKRTQVSGQIARGAQRSEVILTLRAAVVRLALVLIAGTLPGVIGGSVIRVRLLPGARVFDLVVAAVLLPLGIWLVRSAAPTGHHEDERPGWRARPSRPSAQIALPRPPT